MIKFGANNVKPSVTISSHIIRKTGKGKTELSRLIYISGTLFSNRPDTAVYCKSLNQELTIKHKEDDKEMLASLNPR